MNFINKKMAALALTDNVMGCEAFQSNVVLYEAWQELCRGVEFSDDRRRQLNLHAVVGELSVAERLYCNLCSALHIIGNSNDHESFEMAIAKVKGYTAFSLRTVEWESMGLPQNVTLKSAWKQAYPVYDERLIGWANRRPDKSGHAEFIPLCMPAWKVRVPQTEEDSLTLRILTVVHPTVICEAFITCDGYKIVPFEVVKTNQVNYISNIKRPYKGLTVQTRDNKFPRLISYDKDHAAYYQGNGVWV